MKATDTGRDLASEMETDERIGSVGKQDELGSDCEVSQSRSQHYGQIASIFLPDGTFRDWDRCLLSLSPDSLILPLAAWTDLLHHLQESQI